MIIYVHWSLAKFCADNYMDRVAVLVFIHPACILLIVMICASVMKLANTLVYTVLVVNLPPLRELTCDICHERHLIVILCFFIPTTYVVIVHIALSHTGASFFPHSSKFALHIAQYPLIPQHMAVSSLSSTAMRSGIKFLYSKMLVCKFIMHKILLFWAKNKNMFTWIFHNWKYLDSRTPYTVHS